eukprot:scaffold242422_cov35-Attheya_sp.AAC.1
MKMFRVYLIFVAAIALLTVGGLAMPNGIKTDENRELSVKMKKMSKQSKKGKDSTLDPGTGDGVPNREFRELKPDENV